ncbi:unnamed protein product [Sphenostylis stenocarpa]|uniref:Uncharacterized protein n=1 Tax=Sphenostylis stenocarpa TaxID=92480 RepID=A0AA86VZ38_9FABA|nr:unnamed protein product [Sphenostylis stenocarpa]
MKARGPAFRSQKKSKDKDRLPYLRSPLNVHETPPFPSCSPLVPAYVRAFGVDKREACLQVEDTCRIFENYLVEIIVEEGKMRDLMDVEEFLHCWKNLKCPVFIDLEPQKVPGQRAKRQREKRREKESFVSIEPPNFQYRYHYSFSLLWVEKLSSDRDSAPIRWNSKQFR